MGVDTAAADRLPWLADDPARGPVELRPRRNFMPLAAAAVTVVAAGGFWLGTRAVQEPAPPTISHRQRTLTLPLPPPHVALSPEVHMPAGREVRTAPAPDVRPAPPRELHIAPPPRATTAASEDAQRREHEAAPQAARKRSQAVPTVPPTQKTVLTGGVAEAYVPPRPWNPRLFSAAAGRLVQVGAFGSVHQAKRGWWFMVRAYPAMAHLPAVVRPTRNSKGRVFYRFQVGTTSQAHSEVLCQRMLKIRLSCAVVGLPWKAKVER